MKIYMMKKGNLSTFVRYGWIGLSVDGFEDHAGRMVSMESQQSQQYTLAYVYM